jgi:hypothetical protein
VAAAASAHAGQHGLDHRDRAEDVGRELALKVVHRRLFEHPLVSVAGVVDEDVHRAGRRLGAGDGVRDGRVVGHVQPQRVRASGREGREAVRVLVATHGPDHAVAVRERSGGEGATQPRTHARDEKSSRGWEGHGSSSKGTQFIS